MNVNNNQRGFVKSVLIIVGALVLLKYTYKLDVIGYLTDGKFKELLNKFYEIGKYGWDKYYYLIAVIWAKIKTVI
jgi:hypothetical protein